MNLEGKKIAVLIRTNTTGKNFSIINTAQRQVSGIGIYLVTTDVDKLIIYGLI